ncbi:MAG TPA: hypothetical protein ENJ00_05575 [Phycisphaerales bacterium]|nr:hypothetical protein [Phycisphaerales bacterium]
MHSTKETTESKTRGTGCKTGLCSVGLMKSGCPTCFLLGLIIMPFEMLRRFVMQRSARSD